MTVDDNIAAIASLIPRLRQADPDYRVFGSKQHKYEIGPVLCESALREFERAEGIVLPADYRAFLSRVGNGGAGPYYGLEPLETANNYERDLSRPFLVTNATELLSTDDLCWDEFRGILGVCHQGCAAYSYLVVNGTPYGTIWDGREDLYSTGLTFGDWYRRWAELSLKNLENEQLVSRLRTGMSKGDVIAEVGGEWEERVTSTSLGTVRYFEASEIPVQLELDASGRVIAINPHDVVSVHP